MCLLKMLWQQLSFDNLIKRYSHTNAEATIVSLHKSFICAPVNSNSTVTSSHLSRQKNASVKLSANITFHLPKWFFREKTPYSKQSL